MAVLTAHPLSAGAVGRARRVRGVRQARGAAGRSADAGSATVWLLALAMLGCAVFAGMLALGSVVVGRHRAESAADLAALAAADRLLLDPDDGCGRARGIAAAHRATLVSCTADLSADEVEVVVEVPVRGLPLPLGPARARARAGPLWAPAGTADGPGSADVAGTPAGSDRAPDDDGPDAPTGPG
ncbi:Rv3654c family TadE-like protein, partial [Kitasatospora indigofera]|uniref:Rv3654c family TadE-like protein n=1 Tax=Kitasatospora indigofera TaxID=67307 RepID=UPI003690265C